MITSSEEDPALEQKEIEQFMARGVDALLIASAQQTADSFRAIEERKIPYVLIDRRFAKLRANFIGVDDELVGEIGVQHLIEQGCRTIAHIRGPETSTALGRLKGFRRALGAAGMKALPEHVVSIGRSGDDRGELGGREAARKLLSSVRRPDGIFCFNDPVALGAMRSILDAGLRIPEDIALVGCGNVLYSDFVRIPLTSVDQNSSGIGQRAAAMALSLVGSKEVVHPKTELLSPRLVVRASSSRR
jgi:LacI family transcriptional regulator